MAASLAAARGARERFRRLKEPSPDATVDDESRESPNIYIYTDLYICKYKNACIFIWTAVFSNAAPGFFLGWLACGFFFMLERSFMLGPFQCAILLCCRMFFFMLWGVFLYAKGGWFLCC